MADSQTKRDWLIAAYQNVIPLDQEITKIAVLIQEIVYAVLCWRTLQAHRRRAHDYYSSEAQFTLRWARHFLIAMVVVTVIYLGTMWLPDMQQYVTGVSVTIMIFWIGFMGVRQPQIFVQPAMDTKKYAKSGLTPEQAEQYAVSLDRLMKEQKPHLGSELTLSQLAESMHLSTNHLSQILNERLHMSFHDYINFHRAEYAKELLRRHDNPTMLAIAFEAGFRSKSSFNSVFKRYTGMTPKEFQISTRQKLSDRSNTH